MEIDTLHTITKAMLVCTIAGGTLTMFALFFMIAAEAFNRNDYDAVIAGITLQISAILMGACGIQLMFGSDNDDKDQ